MNKPPNRVASAQVSTRIRPHVRELIDKIIDKRNEEPGRRHPYTVVDFVTDAAERFAAELGIEVPQIQLAPRRRCKPLLVPATTSTEKAAPTPKTATTRSAARARKGR